MSEKYDVVIIGAGIGGLTCGCYLAKAGLKVLIVEQHNKPGGYCTSFNRQGYKFDVGVHYLGSLRNGILRRIFDELDIDLKVLQYDPCDKLIFPDNITYIRNDPNATREEFKKCFPKEKKNIDKFFDFILSDNFLDIYRQIRMLTFSKVLDQFFNDLRIKSTLSVLLGNIGLSAKTAAAVPAAILFREYILDCGYYPVGGMQAFPDALARKFQYFGGELLLSKKVVKISTKDKNRIKLYLDTGEEVLSSNVVSNADAEETFKELLKIKSKEAASLDGLKFSSSMFLVYLGIDSNLESMLGGKSNIWYFSSYDVDKIYYQMGKNIPKSRLDCLLCSFPSMHDLSVIDNGKSTAILFVHAPFKTRNYWEQNKDELACRMIARASEIIPGLSSHIKLKILATPHTFYRYTCNKAGSFVGWLSNLQQTKSSIMPQRTSIERLYLVGHWSSIGYPGYGGVPNVAYSGRRGAMLILEDLNLKWPYRDIRI